MIGKRIKLARCSIGYNRSELARLVGVSPQAVQQWEDEVTTPRGGNLRKLSEVLKRTPQYLQFGIDDQSGVENDFENIPVFIESKTFEKIYKDSISHLLSMSDQFNWVELKNHVDTSMVADIGLSFFKKHQLVANNLDLNDEEQFIPNSHDNEATLLSTIADESS